MKKNLFTLFFLGVLVTCSTSLLAQNEKSNAIYLSLVREFTLNPDGSMDYRFIKKQKLLTYRAFQSLYGETFIVTDPVNQKLKIREVYTQMADGKKVIVPSNAMNEVLPGPAANAPAYNNLREMVITHTGLERNAIIYLDYQITTEKGILPALMGNELLAENEPVKQSEIIVRIPVGQNLYYKTFNTTAIPEQTTDGSFKVFTWKFHDIPAISSEENQASGLDLYPRLIFSTVENRGQVCSFLSGQPAFRFEISEPMKTEIKQITNEKTDPSEIILKLQEKVVNDLRLYPIPFRATGYHCRTPEQVWNSNGGTVIEKAVILTAFLKAAGIEALPVGIIHSECSDEGSGTLADIEEFAVKVKCKELGDPVLSVTALNPVSLSASLPGRTFILFRPDGNISFIKSEIPKNRIEFNGVFIVTSDPKITGEISVKLEGNAYPVNSLWRDKNKIKNSISGSLKGNDLKEIKSSERNETTLLQTIVVESDHAFRKDTNYFYFTLPVVKTGIEGWGIRSLSAQREKSFEIPAIADENYFLNFTLPASLKLFTPQKTVSISNKAGSFIWEIKQEQGKLTLKRQIKFNENIYPVSVYPDFKVLMDYWNNPRYRELIFVESK